VKARASEIRSRDDVIIPLMVGKQAVILSRFAD
jgi:hypothetical protein